MERLYRFFDMEHVTFDDEKTVAELIAAVYAKSDCYEPMGMDAVTVYDAGQYRVVTDTSRKCKEELDPSHNNGFCLAYFKKGKFFFAEGGWGHHMTELCPPGWVDDPVCITLAFGDFESAVVINQALTLGEITAFLRNTAYIRSDECLFLVGERLEPPRKSYDVRTADGALPLGEAIRGLAAPLLRIASE